MAVMPKPRCLHGREWDRCGECDADEEPTKPDALATMAEVVAAGRPTAAVIGRTKTRTWPPKGGRA